MLLNEYTVVGVFVTLIGLFFAIYTPLSKAQEKRANERLELEKSIAATREAHDKEISEITRENTAAMVELNQTVKSLVEQYASFKKSSHETHKRLWDHNTEQDKILNNHEYRIKRIEEEQQK